MCNVSLEFAQENDRKHHFVRSCNWCKSRYVIILCFCAKCKNFRAEVCLRVNASYEVKENESGVKRLLFKKKKKTLIGTVFIFLNCFQSNLGRMTNWSLCFILKFFVDR